MTRSMALFLVACLVAAIPVLAFGLVYLPIAAAVQYGGRSVSKWSSRVCKWLNQNRKEKS